MRLVSLRVGNGLGQQNRLAECRDALVVQGVWVTHISRQIIVVGHQPYLIIFVYHIGKHTNSDKMNKEYPSHVHLDSMLPFWLYIHQPRRIDIDG